MKAELTIKNLTEAGKAKAKLKEVTRVCYSHSSNNVDGEKLGVIIYSEGQRFELSLDVEHAKELAAYINLYTNNA